MMYTPMAVDQKCKLGMPQPVKPLKESAKNLNSCLYVVLIIF